MSTAAKFTSAQHEASRSAFLEQLCRQIEQWRDAGATLSKAISKARGKRRARLFKHGRLSRGSLIRLYYAWRENRTPAVFVRNYKAGGFKPRIPLALIEEFLNRLTADRVVSAKAVMQSLRSDWKLGRSIPGLGTWPEYWQRLHGEAALRTVPPAFPVSVTTLYSYLSSSTPGAYQKRIYKAAAREKIEEADSLNEKVQSVWPLSTTPSRGIYRESTSAQQAIDYFRQEQFWTKGDIQSLSESESLIRKIVRFYSRVDYLLREIDAENEEQVLIWKHVLPQVTPNPYAAALEN